MSFALAKRVYRKLMPHAIRHGIYQLRNRLNLDKSLSHQFAYNPSSASRKTQLDCDVCRGSNIASFNNGTTAKLAYKFYQCSDCSFIFIHPKPAVADTYSEGTVVDMGQDATKWNTYYLDCIEKYAPNKGRLLEIGFGDAGFLTLAHERSWEVHGIELSNACVQNARELRGLPNIQAGKIERAAFPDKYFDVIAAFNFIEHIVDLRSTLACLGRILCDNGLLVLLCPNMEGLVHRLIPELFGDKDPLNISWVPPYHLSYFNKSNFKLLLENTGFEIVGDDSRGTNLLWLQHEVTFGPQVTDQKLEQLLNEIRCSEIAEGELRVSAYWTRIVELIRAKLVWTLASTVMPLESALDSSNAILYICRKT